MYVEKNEVLQWNQFKRGIICGNQTIIAPVLISALKKSADNISRCRKELFSRQTRSF